MGSRTGKVRDPVFSSAHKGVPHFIGCCTPFGFSVACFPNGKNTPKLCKRQTADLLRTRRTVDRILQKERRKARLHPQR